MDQPDEEYRPKRGRKKRDLSIKAETVDFEEDLAVDPAEKIPNKPVFSDPEEKAKFDTILNIDLTMVSSIKEGVYSI